MSPLRGLYVVERAIKEAKPRQTCARRIGSEPRKRVVRKGTSRFQFVPVCGKPEQTGTLMGAGPGALPSAFICAICGSFPAGRAAARARSKFKVQGSKFKVQGSTVQGSTVQAFKGSLSSRLPVFPVQRLWQGATLLTLLSPVRDAKCHSCHS